MSTQSSIIMVYAIPEFPPYFVQLNQLLFEGYILTLLLDNTITSNLHGHHITSHAYINNASNNYLKSDRDTECTNMF